MEVFREQTELLLKFLLWQLVSRGHLVVDLRCFILDIVTPSEKKCQTYIVAENYHVHNPFTYTKWLLTEDTSHKFVEQCTHGTPVLHSHSKERSLKLIFMGIPFLSECHSPPHHTEVTDWGRDTRHIVSRNAFHLQQLLATSIYSLNYNQKHTT